MAQDVAQIEPVLDSPMPVKPAAIEAEFSRIWRDTAGAGADASSIRLRVVNFVAIGNGTDALDRFTRVMQALPQHHPCRGVLAITSPGQQSVDASISAYCWRASDGGRHLCSEEILLRGGPGDENGLASTVLALLVPELPVAAWLIGEHDPESRVVSRVVQAADRVFVDSGGADDVAAAFGALHRLRTQYDAQPMDLAWCRCTAWRGLVAQFFDGTGVAHLKQLRSIEIVGGAKTPSAEVLLLAGWFISRLGLSLADIDARSASLAATLYDGTRGVELTVRAHEMGVALGEVRVRAGDDEMLVELHPESGHMHVRQTLPGGEEAVHAIVDREPEDDASVFAAALDEREGAVLLLEALDAAMSLLAGAS